MADENDRLLMIGRSDLECAPAARVRAVATRACSVGDGMHPPSGLRWASPLDGGFPATAGP